VVPAGGVVSVKSPEDVMESQVDEAKVSTGAAGVYGHCGSEFLLLSSVPPPYLKSEYVPVVSRRQWMMQPKHHPWRCVSWSVGK